MHILFQVSNVAHFNPFSQNMNLCLHPLPSTHKTITCAIPKKKKEKLYKKYQTKKRTLAFPKSYPTPLLPSQNLQSRSKLQALETIITNIENSIRTGIIIDDPQIFASLLETCFQLKAIEHGIKVQTLIPEKLLRKNIGIKSKLVRLFACNGQIEKAHEMFDEMPEKNSFAWNSLISGYADAGLYEDALALYFQMMEEGVEPDQYTFPRVLKACGGVGVIHVGEEIHRHVIRAGVWDNTFVLNAIVDMYAKCGDIVRARRVFDCIENKELVSWNSMINGYVKHGLMGEALTVFRSMVKEGYEPDSITLSAILTSILPLKVGYEIHGWAFRHGIEENSSVLNSLMIFYANHCKLRKARRLFDSLAVTDLFSWNSIISAHSKSSLALEYFNLMIEANITPDRITFISVLSACAHLGYVKDGEEIFWMMIDKYVISPTMEHYACMVNLYGRAGLVEEAYEFIEEKVGFEAGATVWGALLYSCFLHGKADVAEIAAKHLFELEPDGEHNFDLLMKIYRNLNRHEDVERVRAMMAERGL